MFKIKIKMNEDSKNKSDDDKFAVNYVWSRLIVPLIAAPILLIFGVIYESIKRYNYIRQEDLLLWAAALIFSVSVWLYSFYWKKKFGEDLLWKNINYYLTCLIAVFAVWKLLWAFFIWLYGEGIIPLQ
ncbi:MAG: hypothetical protein PHO30_06065 [Candidatus Omnitrophica bacterium]|nr:hypothetical protein [Candidatus Omnitrophota bacterium]